MSNFITRLLGLHLTLTHCVTMKGDQAASEAAAIEALKKDRDTAASQLTLLAAKTEDLLQENRYPP